MSAINCYKSVYYRAVLGFVNHLPIWFKVALFAFLFGVSLSAQSQSISLTLVGRDSRTGMQINPQFEAKSTTAENKFTVSSTNNYKVVKVQRGNDVTITAQLDGYYPDEKTVEVDDSFDNDGRTIVFELDPQPAASLSFEIKDKVNNKKVDATLTFKSAGKIIKQINSVNGSNLSNIILTLPGEYTIETSALGYETSVINETIRVNDPVVQLKKEIKLSRASNAAFISVVDKQSGKTMPGALVRITNDKSEVLKNDRSSAAEMEINLKNSESITIEVAADGYLKYSKQFDLNLKKISVELEREPQIYISAVDSQNGNLMAVNVVIITPSGKTITLKSTSTEPFKFIPEQTGVYQFNISKEGFNPEASTVNISQLANYIFELKFAVKNVYEDYTILAVDESKKTLINAVIKVFGENNEELDFKKNQATGEATGKLNKATNYNYRISSAGFITAAGKLDVLAGSATSVITLKKELVPVILSTFDKFTNKPVKTSLAYEGSNKTTYASEKHEVILPAGSVISPIFTAPGYKKYQAEQITNQTDAEIFMMAEQYPITFQFADQRGNIIKPDYLSVINQTTNQSVTLTTTNLAQLDAEVSYTIIIKNVGFVDREMLFNPAEVLRTNNGVKIIELSQSPFVEQKFRIVNSKTNEPVLNAKVVVQSPNGKLYEVSNDDNIWATTLKIGEEFSIAVEAVGFENNAKQFIGNNADILEIKLEKLQLDAQFFEAYDEILNRPVAAKFTLFDEDSSKDLPTFDQRVHAKAELIKGKKYTIRISAPDYQDKEEDFIFESPSILPKRISFKRNFYPITIKLITASEKLLRSPNLSLTANNQAVKTNYLFDKKAFSGEIRIDEVYDLLINVAGFKTVNEKLKLGDIVAANLIKEIQLEEIVEVALEPAEEVTLPEVVITSDKQAEIPSVEEEIQSEIKPVVIADIYTKNKENLKDLPENIAELAKTLASEEALGKRYILTKVYFERSTSTMKAESDEQLNSILAVLSANPKLKVELVGHTDNVGDTRQNQYLSKFRAKVVSSFLFNKGIDDSRVIIKGLGSEFPVAPNDTEDNKAQNRRVELIVIEN